ncbi:DUF4913 domain-containing protein [Nocardia neocaledoniensis]|uniref:DUF4913 domain-containing protein n=1 Tax=Nocardia neocaledoniensis TaxID=236511 RepID=UPI0024545B08|nr:DUF4913 domain-containing protein [Nocardia neocaledoniensis]
MTTTENTTENTEIADPSATEAAAVLGGVDLTESLSAAVRKAVNSQVAAAAKEIAAGAVTDFLTDDVVATMRETALLEAEAAVNPDAAAAIAAPAQPEPEPEAAPAAEPEEEPRKLRFERLDLFVEQYVANMYRREVSRRGTEAKIRWCPQWWDHGEAVGRLDALWTAFEQMRLGEGSEMAAWWTQFADPLMAALFDIEGVFKYCSVTEGHNTTMKRLPTVPAPQGWFQDGHAHDGPEPGMTASGLYLPPPSTGKGRVVVAIDEFGE